MHYLLTAIGSYGDVHPLVGLGVRLRQRGHRVTVVTNPYFEQVVATAGLELAPIRAEEDYLRLIDYPHVWHPTRSVPYLFREAIVELMRPLHHILSSLYKAGETVLVAHTLDAASRVFREQTGAPLATVTLAPQAIWSRHAPPTLGGVPVGPHYPGWWNNVMFWLGNRTVIDPALRWPLNAWRRELGLPAVGRLFPDWWFATDANICLFPEWFAPLQPDWPRPIAAVGFPLWDAGEGAKLTDSLEQFLANGSPPLVFTPGTANRHATEFFHVAAGVCQRLGRRGVLLTKFAAQIPTRLPAGVAHFEFVPLSQLLPRCAAFVHHGGVGSSSQALGAGVPQLIHPLAFDQYDNAARLRQLGVSQTLPGRSFNVPRAAAALAALTDSSHVAERCAQWREACDANGLDRACDVLERLRA